MDRSCYSANARSSLGREFEKESEPQWVTAERDSEAQQLPPGFRFHPTDEELIIFYLAYKIQDPNFSDQAIAEADLNKCEPWELPGKAKMGEKEWYFYSLKDRKYPTGVRTNRATQAGYWKATGKDREVMGTVAASSRTLDLLGLKGKLVGMKKTLVFYSGRAPKGTKSNWVMHEYRAEDALKNFLTLKSCKDEWVLCRVFHKNSSGKKMALEDLDLAATLPGSSNSQTKGLDSRFAKMVTTLPPLTEIPWNPEPGRGPCSFMAGQSSNIGQVLTYATGHTPSMQGFSYATGGQFTSGMISDVGEPHFFDAGGGDGSSVIAALYQHYNQQINYAKPEPEDHHAVPFLHDGQLQLVHQGGSLQTLAAGGWAGGRSVDATFSRTSPDSCGSSLEFPPSPHLASSIQQQSIVRLPSDLDSLLAAV